MSNTPSPAPSSSAKTPSTSGSPRVKPHRVTLKLASLQALHGSNSRIRQAVVVVPVLLLSWLIGYLGLSSLWVVIAIALYFLAELYSRDLAVRRKFDQLLHSDELNTVRDAIDILPSWAYFPDVERAEWVNQIIRRFWPFMRAYVDTLLRQQIAGEIKKYVKELEFTSLDLGSVPPRVASVKVYSTNNLSPTEIMLDLELNYLGDAHVTFSWNRIKAGVKDIHASGTLRVILRPLLPKLPLFGGISVSLLRSPHIDFDFTDAAIFADFSLVKDKIMDAVDRVLRTNLIAPKRLDISISSDITQGFLQNLPLPKGLLRVTVVRGIDLVGRDPNLLGRPTSDPYCKLTYGGTECQTDVVESNNNPVWNKTFEYYITDSSLDLQLECFDKDRGGNDDFLGRIRFPISEAIDAENSHLSKNYALVDIDHGAISLTLDWYSLSDKEQDIPTIPANSQSKGNTAYLYVQAFGARNLPRAQHGVEPSPQAVLQINDSEGSQVRTDIREKTRDPYFDKGMHLDIRDARTSTLLIKVYDMTDKDKQRLLAEAELSLKDVMKAPHMIFTNPIPLKNAAGLDAYFYLACALRAFTKSRTEDSCSSDEEVITAMISASEQLSAAKKQTSQAANPAPKPPSSSTNPAKPADAAAAPATPASAQGDFVQQKRVESVQASPRSVAPATPAQSIPAQTVRASSEPLVKPPEAAKSLSDRKTSSLRKRESGASAVGVASSPSNLGRIQLAFRFNANKSPPLLGIHIIQCSNLVQPQAEEQEHKNDIFLDPFVELNLLLGRGSGAITKRTEPERNTIHPRFDVQFEFTLAKEFGISSPEQLLQSQSSLFVTVKHKHKAQLFSKSSSPTIGQCSIDFNSLSLDVDGFLTGASVTRWLDLEPAFPSDHVKSK